MKALWLMPSSKMLLTSAILFIMALAAAPADGQCFSVLEEGAPCGDCPGNSACLCFYSGHNCPGTQTICFDIPFIAGGRMMIAMMPTLCYTIQNCKSADGGPCHTDYNPCVLNGGITEVMGVKPVEICPCPIFWAKAEDGVGADISDVEVASL